MMCEDITNQQMLEDSHRGDIVVVWEPERELEITFHALTG